MPKVTELKHYRINSLELINKPRQNGKMQLENKYSYNVKYADNNTCLAELSVAVSDKAAPELFTVKLVIVGIFDIMEAGRGDRYTVHYETYRTMFAHAQAAITQVTAMSGIAPVIIPEIDIENQEIYQFKMPDQDKK